MTWPGVTVAGLATVPVAGSEDLCALMTGNTTSWCVVVVSQVVVSQPGVWSLVNDAVLSIRADWTVGVVTENVSVRVVGVTTLLLTVPPGTVRVHLMVGRPLVSITQSAAPLHE